MQSWWLKSRAAATAFLHDRGFDLVVSRFGIDWVGTYDGAGCRAFISPPVRRGKHVGVWVTFGA